MTSVQFAFWLQGVFELGDIKSFDEKQTTLIRQHLALVEEAVSGGTVSVSGAPPLAGDVVVTVCANCRRRGCLFFGELRCDARYVDKTLGTTERTVEQLRSLNAEHASYWSYVEPTTKPARPAPAEFFALINKRLATGERVYGDASFERPTAELIGEIEEELLDIVGWSYVVWCRLVALKKRVEAEK